MSSMQYISAKAHVVMDSESARNLAKKAMAVFSCSNWDVEYQKVSDEAGEGFTDVVVMVGGYDSAPSGAIDVILGEIATLGNGSYGLMICESDWGIDAFDCYGNVKLVEAESVDGDVTWSSEDFLDLSVSMEAETWRELLECDSADLADEIESQADELLSMLLPESFVQACEDDGEVFFEYRDMEMSDEEPEDESDEITVIFEFDGHDIRNETFDALIDALNGSRDEFPVPEAKILLKMSSVSEENGAYESKLVDADAPAMLIFKSSLNGIDEVRVLVPEVKEQ